MGFFKKLVKGAGNFAKKIATSGVGKTVLGAAATIVGGPAAGAAVGSLTSMIGEKKAGEMASKVVSDGTVKESKVIETLAKIGINPSPQNIADAVTALKYSAQGIANKPITVTKSASFAPSSTSTSSNTLNTGSFMDKVKNTYYKVKTWVVENSKTVLIGLGIVALGVVGYFGFFKKTKYRR